MRKYKRATRASSFSEFPPEITAAIRKYAEKNDFGDFEADILMCAETSSEKLKQGVFSKIFGDGKYALKTFVVVTPERILWATLDNKTNAAVLAARFSDVEVKDFSSPRIEDSGIEIFGFIDDFAGRGSAFIALGEDAAGHTLRR